MSFIWNNNRTLMLTPPHRQLFFVLYIKVDMVPLNHNFSKDISVWTQKCLKIVAKQHFATLFVLVSRGNNIWTQKRIKTVVKQHFYMLFVSVSKDINIWTQKRIKIVAENYFDTLFVTVSKDINIGT